jgi:DNA-binding transcriptional ArsR family regulator
MYTVRIDWAPAYELIVSLMAFLSVPDHKTLELGSAWVQDVRRGLTRQFSATLSAEKPLAFIDLLNFLIRYCPGERTAEEFIAWLPEPSPGQLYEWLDPLVPAAKAGRLSNLSGVRDRAVSLLCEWNRQYFSAIDPQILVGLAADAAEKRRRLTDMSPESVVEWATGGITIDAHTAVDVVTLIPQYHFRPWNVRAFFRGERVIHYPVDALPLNADDVPPRLRRLTKALADDSRLRILRLLATEPATFSAVVAATGLSKSTVNHHLVMLRAAGLVRVHDVGDGSTTYTLQPAALDGVGYALHAYLSPE